MRDNEGNLVDSRQDIADVFATFYEDLYSSTRDVRLKDQSTVTSDDLFRTAPHLAGMRF